MHRGSDGSRAYGSAAIAEQMMAFGTGGGGEGVQDSPLCHMEAVEEEAGGGGGGGGSWMASAAVLRWCAVSLTTAMHDRSRRIKLLYEIDVCVCVHACVCVCGGGGEGGAAYGTATGCRPPCTLMDAAIVEMRESERERERGRGDSVGVGLFSKCVGGSVCVCGGGGVCGGVGHSRGERDGREEEERNG